MAGVLRAILMLAMAWAAGLLLVRLLRTLGSNAGSGRRRWGSGRGGVDFDARDGGADPADIAGQTDAFTGEPLVAARGLFRCQRCRATYHADSYRLLEREHGGRCLACTSPDIRPLAGSPRA